MGCRRKWRLYCPSLVLSESAFEPDGNNVLALTRMKRKTCTNINSNINNTVPWHKKFSIRSYILQWLPERVFCYFALLACVQSLVPVNSPPMCGRLAVRMQMARDLLSGELRILKSASMWLKSYCTTLTTTAYHCEDVGDYRAIPGWTRELSDTGVSHELHGRSA